MTEPTYSYGRQIFRFRLPWMYNPTQAAIPAPSEPKTTAPSEPLPRTSATTIPIRQRPSGTPAPPPSLPPIRSQLNPPAASPIRTVPQPPPPSPVRRVPQPPPPSPMRTAPQPPPPSATTSQSRATQMPSLSGVQPQTASSSSSSSSQSQSELQTQTTTPRPQAAASQPLTPSRTPVSAPSLPPPQPKVKPPAASPMRTQTQPPAPSPSTDPSRTTQLSPQSLVQPQTASSSLSQSRSEFQTQTTAPRPQAAAAQPAPTSRTAIQPRTSPSKATAPTPQQPSSPKTKPKPSSPSPATSPPKTPKTPPRTESSTSKVVSQPPPSQTTTTKTQSSLTSPTPAQRSTPPTRVALKTQSPAKLASQPPAKTSSPPTTSQGANLQASSHVSPSPVKQKNLQSQAQVSSQSPSLSKSSSSKAAKYEPALSVPLAMKSQPLAEVSSVPASQPQSQIHKQASSGQNKTQSPRFSTLPAVVAPTPPEKPATQLPESSLIPADLKEQPKFKTETEEEKQKTESSTGEKKTITGDVEEPKVKSGIEFLNTATDHDEQHRGLPRAAASQVSSTQLRKQAHGDENGKTRSSILSSVIPGKGTNTTNEPHPRPSVSQGEKTSLQKEIKDDISRFVHKLGSGHQMQPTEPVSVITLTGENKGASMHVGAELERKESSVPINRGYKLNHDDSTDLTTDGEGSSRGRKTSNSKENTESLAYINSNVQSINNSLIFSSSISERNPGVRFVSESSNIDPVKTNGKEKSVEAHKADFNVTQSQKLTYEPTIRRRCLRGLFLEPESDPDNPDKPRRHGCRYNCKENEKCNDNKNGGSEIW